MRLRLFSFLCAAALLAACATPPGIQRVSAGQTVDIASAGTQLSVQRAQGGILRPLVHNPALQGAAQSHANDIVATGQLSHTGSDGSTPQSRVAATGYTACITLENVAQGQTEVRRAIADWMGSEGHRANILNPQATQFGFARSADTWVLVLARPC